MTMTSTVTSTEPMRIDSGVPEQAKAAAAAEGRSTADQIEFRAKVARAARDNPDLPVSFVAEVMASLAEPREDATAFVPRRRRR